MPGDTRFQPDMPVTISPPDVEPSHDNSEIAYVTDVDGLVLTLIRAQEDSIAMQVASGWVVRGTLTAKTITDLEQAVERQSDVHYVYPFAPASSVNVIHNLGKYPSVTVVDTAGDECVGDVNYVSGDELTVSFSNPFGGVLYLN